MDQLGRLTNWYAAQCDGDWEHLYGIRIDTLDNPGWLLEIDITDTPLQEKVLVPVHRGDSEMDESWLFCSVADGQFKAAGGVPDLPDMLEQFLRWAGH